MVGLLLGDRKNYSSKQVDMAMMKQKKQAAPSSRGWRSRLLSPLQNALAIPCVSSVLGCLAFVLMVLHCFMHSHHPHLLLPATTVKLHRTRLPIPRLGFGTAGLGEATESATSWALQAGYRLIDSAQATEWYNEKAVGRAIRTSNVSREQLYLVSKLHPRHLGYEVTKQQFFTSLKDLGTSYLDLFLLHYPRCFSGICNDVTNAGSWQASWKALEELHDELKIREIGVSNFNKEELQELLAIARIKPSVVQRNSDPFNADKELQDFCQKRGIQYMGYSTLGSQWLMKGHSTNPVLNHPVIRTIAVAQSCTPAQVVLSWAMDKKQVVIPRSSNRFRIKENLEAQHCNLSRLQVSSIDELDGQVLRVQ